MGFFSNVDNSKAIRETIACDVYDFIKSHSQEFVTVYGDAHILNPKLVTFPLNLIDRRLEEVDNKARGSVLVDNQLFYITDDFKVIFKVPICITKLKDIPPFELDPLNDVSLKTCSSDIMDWLPTEINVLSLLNTHRSNNTIEFKKLKYVTNLYIVGDTHIKSLSGLESIEVLSIIIKNCPKLITTNGCPRVGVERNIDTNRIYTEKPNICINSCKELEVLDFPLGSASKVYIFITEKTCPKISKIISLPKEIGFIGCKNFSTDDFKGVDSVIDYFEVSDFKGKGSDAFNRHLSSREEVIEKLKGIVDDIRKKHWRIFDDLAAVLTYYGLEDYARIEKSGYVENGMIHCYSASVDLGGRYHHEFTRYNIKNGVTRYLNQLGVQYSIINTSPKKSKDSEYIKIL